VSRYVTALDQVAVYAHGAVVQLLQQTTFILALLLALKMNRTYGAPPPGALGWGRRWVASLYAAWRRHAAAAPSLQRLHLPLPHALAPSPPPPRLARPLSLPPPPAERWWDAWRKFRRLGDCAIALAQQASVLCPADPGLQADLARWTALWCFGAQQFCSGGRLDPLAAPLLRPAERALWDAASSKFNFAEHRLRRLIAKMQLTTDQARLSGCLFTRVRPPQRARGALTPAGP
jgi:hypothetical protein